MAIQFNSIPSDLRTPGQYIEFDNSRALQGLPGQQQRILVIGQRITAGLVAAGVPTLITNAPAAEEAFGRGSMLANMFKALKAANPRTESWGIALDDNGAGVQATGTFTPTGPATAAGTLYLYIAGQRILVGVAVGDTRDQIAAKVTAAINAQTDLPVTAATTGGAGVMLTTVTARHKGEAGNYIDLRCNYYQGEKFPTGVVVTASVMAAGVTNPTIATAIVAIGDAQYQTIVNPYTDTANLVALEAELLRRWGPMVMKESHAFAAVKGSVATMQALGNARNSPFQTIMAGGKSPASPWELASVVAGVDAAEPDPARPRQTLPLTGILPPVEQDRLNRDERDLLLHDGIATSIVDAGGTVLIERLVTTYQVNGQGVPDTSYLDVETMRTLAYIRFARRVRISLKWGRHKLANDGTQFGPGQAIVTPSIIRADGIAFFRELEEVGLVENFDQFVADYLVERDVSDPNRINEQFPPDIINQFRVFAGQVQFRL